MQYKKVLSGVVLVSAFVATGAVAGPVFDNPGYSADITFQEAGSLVQTSMTIAYDGGNYWSTTGGGSSGTRLARYDAAGNVVGTYAPGLDFRSIFTDGSGNVFARRYANATIYQQTAPGVFSDYLTLTGGSLDNQSSVVMNEDGQYVAMKSGNVTVWDATGAFDYTFTLNGFSGSYPYDRGIAVAEDYLFTYYNQTLSAWDYAGNLLDQTTLAGAGTSFDSYFSLSYANDHIFVVDYARGLWRGYDIGLSTQRIPEPGTLALLGLGLAAIGFARKWKRAG